MKIKDRLRKKSPKLFQRITNACVVVGAVGAVIISAPISLPVLITSLAGYMVVAGSIGASISKLTVDNKEFEDENER